VPLSGEDISRLYRREAAGLLVFFSRRVFHPEVAVELVGETFAAAFTDRAQFRGSSDEEAIGWIYGIARHQLSGYLRRGAVERSAMSRLGVERRALSDPEYERIEELSVTAELREAVARLVEQLAPGQREALRLRVIEELSYAEVAARLDISEENARTRVSRALRAIAGHAGLSPNGSSVARAGGAVEHD
jgi:RNA polymerase sigma factor (sigma-70 family)